MDHPVVASAPAPPLPEHPYRQVGGPFLPQPWPFDPRMVITLSERNDAMVVRQAAMARVESVEQFRVPRDLECLQHTLLIPHQSRGDVSLEKVVDRIVGLHYFRQEYNVRDTIEDAVETLRQLWDQQPGLFLHFETMSLKMDPFRQNPRDPRGIDEAILHLCGGTHGGLVMDMSCLDPATALADPRPLLVSLYYIYQASFPYAAAMRAGFIHCLESAAVNMGSLDHQRQMVEIHQKIATELLAFYPCHYRHMRVYNSTTAMNMILGVTKPFLPHSLMQSVQLECRWPEEEMPASSNVEQQSATKGRLPPPLTAREVWPAAPRRTDYASKYFLGEVIKGLSVRYYIESTFAL